MMTIKEMNEIKEFRGYSFDVLSVYSGVPRATVVNVLTGASTNPRMSTLQALETVLGGEEKKYPGRRYHYLHNQELLYGSGEEPKYSYEVKEPHTAYDAGEAQKPITAEEFLEMYFEYPVELINGRIFRRSEPDWAHSEISEYFYDRFKDYIREKKGKCRPKISNTNVQLPREEGLDSVVCPDFFVICDDSKIRTYGIDGPPDFALEVVSKDNRKNDYVRKLQKYSFSGVREYWIVDPFRDAVMINVFEETEESYCPRMLPLKGKAEVHIYDGQLKIDLDEIHRIIEDSRARGGNASEDLTGERI